MRNLVVGAGLTGAVLAERIASQLDEEVVVIEKKNYIGGVHYDYRDSKTGIIVQPYAQVFHTGHKYIWDYLSEFTDWELLYYTSSTIIQGTAVSYPITLQSLYDVFPEQFAKMFEDKLLSKFGYNARLTLAELSRNFDEDLKFLANYFYENVFKPLTVKQLGISPDSLPDCQDTPFPIYVSSDTRVSHDKYQAVPKDGYSAMIENILDNKKIKLKLNTEFTDINSSKFDRIFYTGSIDEYFDYKFGELPYRSSEFETVERAEEYFQSGGIFTHPTDYDFIKSIEHKYFRPDIKSDKTIVTFEYPKKFELGKNERYYPITSEESKAVLEKYLQEATTLQNVYFAGRLGTFKSYSVAETVHHAFETIAEIISLKHSGSEVMETTSEFEENE